MLNIGSANVKYCTLCNVVVIIIVAFSGMYGQRFLHPRRVFARSLEQILRSLRSRRMTGRLKRAITKSRFCNSAAGRSEQNKERADLRRGVYIDVHDPSKT